MSQPYIVRSDEGGHAATVFDRATGEKVGRVLQDFYGNWEAVDLRRPSSRGSFHRRRDEAAGVLWRRWVRP